MEIQDNMTQKEWAEQYAHAKNALRIFVQTTNEAFRDGNTEPNAFEATTKTLMGVTNDPRSFQMVVMALAAAVTLMAKYGNSGDIKKS